MLGCTLTPTLTYFLMSLKCFFSLKLSLAKLAKSTFINGQNVLGKWRAFSINMIQREVKSGIFSVKILKLKSNLERDTLMTSETEDLVQWQQSKVSSIQCKHDRLHVLFTGYKVSKSVYDSRRKKSSSYQQRLQNLSENHSGSSSKNRGQKSFLILVFQLCTTLEQQKQHICTKAVVLSLQCKNIQDMKILGPPSHTQI